MKDQNPGPDPSPRENDPDDLFKFLTEGKEGTFEAEVEEIINAVFDLDEKNKVSLLNGRFYHITLTTKDYLPISKKRLLFMAPLDVKALVKVGEGWMIKYLFDNGEHIESIDTMLTSISEKLRLDRNSTKMFAQWLYKYKERKERTGKFEVITEAVGVEDGKIKVNQTSDQPTKEILEKLVSLHGISTFPEAFLVSLDYALLSPFSYEIRSKGQKFPYRLLAGKTHGGKTSTQTLISLKGFDQSLKERKETLNTIKTIFTLGQQVEKSRLSFVVDDINNQWLNNHCDELKGATDSVKFMARGTRSQSQNIWDMNGMPVFTMNEEPVIPLALKDRIIMDRFTEKHAQRQNKAEYEKIANGLKPGFMLNLIKETLEGRTIEDILQNVHYAVKTDQEINQRLVSYAHSLLKELARKYGVAFPEAPTIDDSMGGYSLLDTFCTYVATRFYSTDKDGSKFQKFNLGRKGRVMLINIGGYNDFKKEYRISGMESMTDFINEVKDDRVVVAKEWFQGLGKTVHCIVVPIEYISKDLAGPES
ncbi:MAG: hypothetical protein M1351_06535 [Candidatus Thermoplasmatota archaeon]|nr:hypothetical protein [Candidatus Thermoplasmatota archaeon]